MAKDTLLTWTPDMRLPVRSALQEFVSHDRELTLRICLRSGQETQVEVHDRVVAETDGFARATALAELYTRKGEVLLNERSASGGKLQGSFNYYRIRAGDGEYELCTDVDPTKLVDQPENFCPIPRCRTLPEAIDVAADDAGVSVVPTFFDQLEIYDGLERRDSHGLMVAIWISRWQTPFLPIFHEEDTFPLYLAVSRGFDGAYFTIYELINRKYLTEIRSHDMAEEIGKFDTIKPARAYCDLFNAARHSPQWISFTSSSSNELTSLDSNYLLEAQDKGFTLWTNVPSKQSLGHFSNRRQAEAYATVHKDALEHFALKPE